jgi:hypothetical protein
MKKEDVEVVAGLLTALKDSLSELESALKANNADRVMAAKRKIFDLQIQVGKRI